MDGLHVRAAEPCDDDKVIRDLEIFAHLIDANVFGLLLVGELGAGCSELLGVDEVLRRCGVNGRRGPGLGPVRVVWVSGRSL